MTKWCISNMPGEARHRDRTETFSFHYEKYAHPQAYTQKPHYTTYQQVRKAFTVEEEDKLNVEAIAGLH